jgi:prevent-host-death family protein
LPSAVSPKAPGAGSNRRDREGPAELSWQIQEARARLSSLVNEALAGRPQRISRHGKEVAVIISAADYDRLTAPRESLVEFFRNSPLAEAMVEGELDLERDRDAIRGLPP